MNRFVPRRSFHANLRILNSFVNPYIEQALRLSPEELEKKTKSDSGYTFLHALARFTRDRKVIRDQLVAVLLAGRDTTAATLSWLFYELSRHPAIVARLRAEIHAHLGPDRRAPTYTDLKSMRYLQNTLNETLRLYPAVPFKCVYPLLFQHPPPHLLHPPSGAHLPVNFLTDLSQRPHVPQRNHSPPGLRALGPLPHRRPRQHGHRLLDPRHAPPARPVPAPVRALPRHHGIRAPPVGKLDAQELAIHPVQRGSEDLYRAAVRVGRDGLYGREDPAEVRDGPEVLGRWGAVLEGGDRVAAWGGRAGGVLGGRGENGMMDFGGGGGWFLL